MTTTSTAIAIIEASYEVDPMQADVIPLRRIVAKYETREQWLIAAIEALRPIFNAAGFNFAAKIYVSIGFPSTGRARRISDDTGLAGLKGRIAEYHGPSAANKRKHGQIFCTPQLPSPVIFLGVLAHELCHAVAGVDAKHGKEFEAVARAIGLEGKMQSALPGLALNTRLQAIADDLGELDHEQIVVDITTPKQSTRLHRVESTCLDDPETGKRYNANMSQSWLDAAGAPIYPTALIDYLETAIAEGEMIDPEKMLNDVASLRMIIAERKKRGTTKSE
jgi:hypothetical protein